MKKKLSLPILLISIVFFLVMILLSSPYRELRPYSLFGKKIADKNEFISHIVNNRIIVFIPGNDVIPGFYIDQIPVTVDAYKDCINEGFCKTQHYREEYTKIWNQKIYGSFPVTFITWMEARNYCLSYGGDLPTALQWELAAGYGLNTIIPGITRSLHFRKQIWMDFING